MSVKGHGARKVAKELFSMVGEGWYSRFSTPSSRSMSSPLPRKKRRYVHGDEYSTFTTIAARIFRLARAYKLTIRLIISSSVTPRQDNEATLRTEKARERARVRVVSICPERRGETARKPVTHVVRWGEPSC